MDTKKIFITGTGRCGTTFLIKLFTFLDLDTGYTRETYSNYIYSECNSGMERRYDAPFSIIKNPRIMHNIHIVAADPAICIEKVIIPVRDYSASAKSRASHKHDCGGLWCATDEESQIAFYKHIVSNYVLYMTKYNIPTLFLDFDKMTTDKVYLFNQLEWLLQSRSIDFDTFAKAYDDVSETCVKKKE